MNGDKNQRSPNQWNNNSFFSQFPPKFTNNFQHQQNDNTSEQVNLNDPRSFYNNYHDHYPGYPYYYNHHPPYNTTNVNLQCDKCSELQKDIKNMELQIKLMSKNIELLNEQLKLYDMKLSVFMNDKNKQQLNLKNNNQYHNKQNNNNQNKQNKQNQHNNNNKQNQQSHQRGKKNNNIKMNNPNNKGQGMHIVHPFMPFLSKKNDNMESTMIIQIDDNNPQNGIKKSDGVNPLGLLGSIFSLIDKLDKEKDKDKDKKNTNIDFDDEVIDEVTDYNSEEEYDELDIEINTIDDLIKLGEDYQKQVETEKNNKTTNNVDENETNVFIKESDEDNLEKSKKTANKDHVIKGVLMRDGKVRLLSNPHAGKTEKNVNNNKNKVESDKKDDNEKKKYIINGKRYSVNLETLSNLVAPLNKLKKMVGLNDVKNAIVDMILYYLQNFENKNNNMLHTVIEGPPGVGKTQLGKILAEVYSGLGVIPSNKFKLVKRSDLVGEYLGHTAPKTQKVIDEADGGVLFIDEAYSLGNEEKRDSFSKECIDTLNQNLSENKKKFICIIAGYSDELDRSFFAYNPGLKRRFPFKFKIDGYNADELKNIFVKKVSDIKWKLDNDINSNILNDDKENIDKETIENNDSNDNINNNKDNDSKGKKNKRKSIKDDKLTEFFKKNVSSFPYYGGDIDNFLMNCKFAHSRRVFGKHPSNRRKLNLRDIEIGFDRFIRNKKKVESQFIQSMYI
ncbi:CbxX/CfqX protein [Fadolivirus algeromassiliense]|jgi:hypothetical protein|uniref:CbxX/CfqX protein n=1 Tax=Fadolivirus FV1/VV64 TaxID=3070911 RepID=A0A7D3QUF4_9VIRU|nr:CbxX/CfqX protein [Fadolivirus algeromassiliense]QKF94085.1 CbxX/CfqX protein [Fadolivirus FV1/VV64]